MKKFRKATKPGSFKLEPLRGQFFDIKPAKKGGHSPLIYLLKDYTRFALVAFFAFLVLNFGNAYLKGKTVLQESSNLAYAGYGELQQGMDLLLKKDGMKAYEAFKEAEQTFGLLQKTTQPLTEQASYLLSQSEYLEAADILVEMGLQVSEMGRFLASFAQEMKALGPKLLGQEDEKIMEVIHQKQTELKHIGNMAVSLQHKLVNLNPEILPDNLKGKIAKAQGQLGQFLALMRTLDTFTQNLLTLLGDQVPHRYLILLQNNHELRATGGFIGSYLIVDINDGKITKMESKDVYESDGQLSKVLAPPPGIDRLAKQWFMRDANYSPDFPTSAEQIMWFLEASRGPSVDTVIALDQTFVERMLALVGELKVEGLDEPLNADNFSRLLSFYTEAKLSETNTPKQLLFDLIPRFKEKLASLDELPKALALVNEMVKAGHLQFFSRDEALQQLFKDYGLAGEIVPPAPELDYLNVVSSSIAGNKTDEFMETTLTHTTQVQPEGGLVNELTIDKKHTFGENEALEIQKLIDEYGTGKHTADDLKYILGQGHNIDYMRVYVPLGSQLESVEGLKRKDIEVFEDLGYTVFGFEYGPIAPGQEKDVTLKYRLPFDLSLNPASYYRFVAQKQAGVENLMLHKSIKMPQGLEVKKGYPQPPQSRKVPVLEGDFKGTELFMALISSE